MNRWIYSLLVAVPIVLSALSVPLGARAADPVINLFKSEAALGGDGTLTVTETIAATLPGGGHGMFRDIPYAVRLPSGVTVRTPPAVLEVRVDGAARPVTDTEEPSRNVLRVYMRDPGVTLEQGAHTFVVRYAMKYMVGFFDDHDELNWNVTGDRWTVPIERATYALTLPEGAVIRDQIAWLGVKGGRESPVNLRRSAFGGRTAAAFSSRRAIGPGEGLTCAVAWNKGVVARRDVPDDALVPPPPYENPAREPWSRHAAVALAVLMWAYFLFVWRKYGKDPAKGAIIPLFHAPEAPASAGSPQGAPMSPAAVNYVVNSGSLEPRGLSALLLSLAARGSCAFSGDRERGFVVTARPEADTPYAEERKAYARLAEAESVPLGRSGGAVIAAMRGAASKSLAEGYPHLWTSNLGWTLLGMLLASLGAFGCLIARLGLPGDWPPEIVETGLLGLIVVWLLPFAVRGLIASLKGRQFLLALVILAFGGSFAAGLANSLFMPEVSERIPPGFSVPLTLALLAPWVFMGLMKAPSTTARRLLDGCEGLALYIRTAETERLRRFNPPERTPELYTRLLPYAVALNLEKAWGENCADILRDARNRDGDTSSDALYSAVMASTLVSETSEAIAAYEASRSSAFDSGGDGGGSGSGGGGGGGGFC